MKLLTRKAPEPPATERESRQERQHRDRKTDLVQSVRLGWGVKVDVSKLTLAEAEELRELYRTARGDFDYAVDGFGLLDAKERKRVLALLDQCLPDAERERARRVEERRAERELQRFASAVLAEGVPPHLRPGLQPGETILPKDTFEIGTLHLADVGVLALVLHAWSSGNAGVFRGGRFADDGDTLLVPKKLELAVREWNLVYRADATASVVVDVGRSLEHLDRNEFLDAKRGSGGWTIRLGSRMRGSS